MSRRVLLFVFLTELILFAPLETSARTQLESIKNFLDDNHVGQDGFRNSSEEGVTVSATADALQIANVLSINVNNTLDILYYYQRSQNPDGGFGNTPDLSSDLNTTLAAVRGLGYLPVNWSQLHNWEIFEYYNSSVSKLLFENVSKTTGYIEGMSHLNFQRISLWLDYISVAFSLGYTPTMDSEMMIQELLAMQMSNGSYSSLKLATNVILLLNLLGQEPNDADLATKFILAHVSEGGGFSYSGNGAGSLEASYLGVSALDALGKINSLEYKNALTKFILSLQKSNSGFAQNPTSLSTLHDTKLAVLTLFMLKELDELQAPDVLQTVGFVDYPWLFAILPFVLLIRRRKL